MCHDIYGESVMGLLIGNVMGFLIAYTIAAAIMGWLAARKNRNAWAWGLIGGLFLLFGLIVLAFTPYLCPKCKQPITNSEWRNRTCPRCEGDRKETLVSTVTDLSNPQYSAPIVDEDHAYAEIANELEGGIADKGLWTRLFAESGGDERQTKVLYIKQRADQLISAERLRLERAATERAELEAIEKAKLARLSEEQRAYELLPKGHCPNCRAVIPMVSDECPKCRALFTDSSWKVLPIENT